MSAVNGVAVADRLEAVRELLRQRGVALGRISADVTGDALDEGIEALLEREVKLPVPTVDECRRFYRSADAACQYALRLSYRRGRPTGAWPTNAV